MTRPACRCLGWLVVAVGLVVAAARFGAPRTPLLAGDAARPPSPTELIAARPAARPPGVPTAEPVVRGETAPQREPPAPRSLRGTDPDGAFELDASGHVRASPRAIRVFDYHLTALGELDLAAIRNRVAADAAARLDADGTREAMALYDDYLRYLGAVTELTESAAETLTARELIDRVAEQQRAVFGAERADDLFGEELALATLYFERHELASAPGLSEPDRAAARRELEQLVDDATRAARARAGAPADVRARVAELRRAGASAAEIWRVRAEQLGCAAATRLAELDARRATTAR